MSDSSPFAGGYPTGAVLASMLIFTVLGMGMVSIVMAFVRRTRGWIVAAIILSLLGGAGAITGVVFAVRGVSNVFAQRSQPKTVVSDDGWVRLEIPGTWNTLPELDDESTVKVGNKFREEYALLQSANKADFDSTLDDFAKAVTGAIGENLEGGAEVGAIENAMAGKFPARRCRLAGKVENIRVVYFHYTIETPEGFHQLLMWTLPSKESKARAVFERVAESFEEVNPPPTSDALEKMVKTSPRTPRTGTVEERLRGIFVELGIPAEKVKPEARLKEDLGADDLDLVELVMASEEEFGIEIGDENAEKLTTVGGFIEYVSGKVK